MLQARQYASRPSRCRIAECYRSASEIRQAENHRDRMVFPAGLPVHDFSSYGSPRVIGSGVAQDFLSIALQQTSGVVGLRSVHPRDIDSSGHIRSRFSWAANGQKGIRSPVGASTLWIANSRW